MTKIDSGEKYIHYETDDFDHPDFHVSNSIPSRITSLLVLLSWISFMGLLLFGRNFIEEPRCDLYTIISFVLIWVFLGLNRIAERIGVISKGIPPIATLPSQDAYLFVGHIHGSSAYNLLPESHPLSGKIDDKTVSEMFPEITNEPVICLPQDVSFVLNAADASSVLIPCVIGCDYSMDFDDFFQQNGFPGRVTFFSHVPNAFDDADYNKGHAYSSSGEYVAPILPDIESHRCRVKVYKNTAYLEFYNCDLGFEPEYGESDA